MSNFTDGTYVRNRVEYTIDARRFTVDNCEELAEWADARAGSTDGLDENGVDVETPTICFDARSEEWIVPGDWVWKTKDGVVHWQSGIVFEQDYKPAESGRYALVRVND